MEKFIKILNLLALANEPSLLSMRKKTLEAVSPAQIQGVSLELHSRLNNMQHDLRLNKEIPFLEFFLAHCFNMLMSHPEALEHIQQSMEKFKFLDHEYNAALAHWYLGLLYEDANKSDFCCAELKEAEKLLFQLEKDSALRGSYTIKKKIRDLRSKIKAQYQCASEAPFREDEEPELGGNPRMAQNLPIDTLPDLANGTDEAYLELPWIPVYHAVVNANTAPGVEWVEPATEERSEIASIALDGQIYLLESTVLGIHKVNLSQEKKYGFVKVIGQSMNAFHPPIHAGDYVLFYKSNEIESNLNKVVIASRPVERGYSYLIKQLRREPPAPGKALAYELRSHTTEHGPEYEPMPLGENYSVLGVVVALARPAPTQALKIGNPAGWQAHAAGWIEAELVLTDPQMKPANLLSSYLIEVIAPYLEAIENLYKVASQIKRVEQPVLVLSLISLGSLNFGISFPDWFYTVLMGIFGSKKFEQAQAKWNHASHLNHSPKIENGANSAEFEVEKLNGEAFNEHFDLALNLVALLDPNLTLAARNYSALQLVPHLETILGHRLKFKSLKQVQKEG